MKTSARGWPSEGRNDLGPYELAAGEAGVRPAQATLWTVAALAGIVFLAALLRLLRLDQVPVGFQFDEAYNALDALRVGGGARPIFLPANAGREVLYTYLQALLVACLGSQVWVFRLASALIGIASVPLTYLLVRVILPGRPRRLALLTATLTALSYWHLHFSRYGIRAITLPALMILAVVAFWKGLQGDEGRGTNDERNNRLSSLVFRPSSFLLSGLFLGVAVYAHPASRFIPLVLAGYAAWLAWADRHRWRRCLGGLVLTGLVALIMSLPLARFFWLNPTALMGHPSDVSILAPRVNQGDLAGALLSNAARVAGMFVWHGDDFWTHNLAGRPVFDPLVGAAFLLGLGLSVIEVARRPRDPATGPFILALLWLIVMLLPTLLSDQAPNFSRAIGAMPIVFLLPALGLDQLQVGRLARWHVPAFRRVNIPALAVAVVVVSGGWTVHDYFWTFAAAPQAYYDYDQDKADVVTYLRTAARDHTIYLAPLWATQATVAFLSRDFEWRSFEPSHTLVLPPRSAGRSALYAIPAEQGPQIAALSERLGSLAAREDVTDRYGRPLLAVFRLPTDRLPDAPMAPFGDPRFAPAIPVQADFVDPADLGGPSLQLVGYTPDASTSDGQAPGVTLFWRALQPMTRNYTVFVHLLDGVGQRWGQADAEPGGGSYRTSAWVPGELIIDRMAPTLDRCAPDGAYLLSVGVYELGTGQRLTIANSGLAAFDLGPVRVQSVPLPADTLAPQHRLDAAIDSGGSGPRLIGYDGGLWTLRPGDRLAVTLYWQYSGTQPAVSGQLNVVGSDGSAQPLQRVAPPDRPTGGDSANPVICQALRPRLPTSLARGDYRLEIISGDSPPVALGQVTVQAPDRSFELPGPEHPVTAEFGGQIRLLGYDLKLELGNWKLEDGTSNLQPPTSNPQVRVTLYWQAISETPAGYTVFVHLLDGEGRLRAQHDGPPAGGDWPTTAWTPGEVVRDEHLLTLPADLLPGGYTLAVGLYNPRTLRRLPLTFGGQGDQVTLPGAVEVR